MIKCAGPGCDVEFEPQVWNQKYHDQQCKRNAENNSRRRQYTQDVADAVAASVAPVYLEMEEEEQLEFLRKENARLARAADKYKAQTGEMVKAVYDAAHEAFTSLPTPKVPKPTFDASDEDEETAVVVLGDWQLGKKTPTYSSDICAKRIELLGDKVLRITNIQRADHPIKHLRVWLVGDIVEGEDIFPGQSHLVDASLYGQVGVYGPRILREFVLKMLANFETVTLVGVVGNHGTIGGISRRNYNDETNMDRLLYKIIEWMFEYEPRVKCHIPEGFGERNFYAVDTIGDYSTLLVHGDQFPAPTSLHSYYKKVMGWKDGAIPEHFDDVFMGHYHQKALMTLGSTQLRIVGSPESYNTFAQEVLANMGRPSQHLQFVHPENGITSEHTLWLD